MGEIVFKEESYAIMGAAFAVYAEMGCGFYEAVYQQCLVIEFTERGIPYEREVRLEIRYHGHVLEVGYRTDFLCYNRILVELKALSKLASDHRAQVLNALHASQSRLGLLLNFGHYPGLEYERFVIDPARPQKK